MSTVTRVQHLLGVIAHGRVNHHPVQMVTQRLRTEPTPAQPAAVAQPAQSPVVAPGQNTAWDPHEVWLNRVKKPRETRSA